MTAGRRDVTVSAMTFMRHIATAAARRPRTTILLWLVSVAATAGTVTSAAIVMVAMLAIFATMQFADNKQLGVGLRPRAWRAARVADAR
jgi:hypothetical protein